MVIYFWQNMVAMHQVQCLRALAERHEVHWLVDRELNDDRRSQGWVTPDTGNIAIRVVTVADVGPILDAADPSALHVFAPRGCAAGPTLLRAVRARRLRYLFLAELPSGAGHALKLRGWIYRWLACRHRAVECVLAMGEHGAAWYRAHGFRRVHAFGYTVADSVLPAPEAPVRSDGVYRLVCTAQLIPQKNHRILLEALSRLSGAWSLLCIGKGPLGASLRALAERLGLATRIRWVESLPNAEARAHIADADTLVLPSVWEGWGAVVNEAIAEGTRVVCSDAPGAACLLGLGDVGEVFPSGDVAALAAALERQRVRGPVGAAERAARRALHRRINGEAMAAYFEKIVAGATPAAPWTHSEA